MKVKLSVVLFFAVAVAFAQDEPEKKIIYKDTKLDFEGADIEGELKNPSEFYFQFRPQQKFDSLAKRRENFHREMLRDVVRSK